MNWKAALIGGTMSLSALVAQGGPVYHWDSLPKAHTVTSRDRLEGQINESLSDAHVSNEDIHIFFDYTESAQGNPPIPALATADYQPLRSCDTCPYEMKVVIRLNPEILHHEGVVRSTAYHEGIHAGDYISGRQPMSMHLKEKTKALVATGMSLDDAKACVDKVNSGNGLITAANMEILESEVRAYTATSEYLDQIKERGWQIPPSPGTPQNNYDVTWYGAKRSEEKNALKFSERISVLEAYFKQPSTSQ